MDLVVSKGDVVLKRGDSHTDRRGTAAAAAVTESEGRVATWNRFGGGTRRKYSRADAHVPSRVLIV